MHLETAQVNQSLVQVSSPPEESLIPINPVPAGLGTKSSLPSPTEPAVPERFTPTGEYAEADVVVAAYPKSGNTWVQALLAGALYGLDLGLVPDTLVQDLVPDVHWKKFFRRYRTPMFFKSHSLPTPAYRRVIYLLRDGRDVMVSYWHHLRALNPQPPDFLEMVRSGAGLYPCKWHQHVAQWLDNPYDARLLIVRYEDLLQDPARQLARMLEFAGIERSLDQLESAARRAAFNAMQRRERRFGWDNRQWPSDRAFVRRGAAGSYLDEMPPAVLAAFMSEAGALLEDLGYAPKPAHAAPGRPGEDGKGEETVELTIPGI